MTDWAPIAGAMDGTRFGFMPKLVEGGFVDGKRALYMEGLFTADDLRRLVNRLEHPMDKHECGMCQAWGFSPRIIDGACRECQRTEAQIVAIHGTDL